MAETLFTAQVPANTNAFEATTLTLGTIFTVAVNGTCDGIQWRFPDTLPGGTVQGLLYQWNSDASGTLLASGNFVAPVAGTYNTMAFGAPVAIVTGQRYVAAVFTTNRYTFTNNFFDGSSLTNGNITGPASDNGTPARNGKFLDTPFPAYPTNSFEETCYFVGPVFTASSAATGIAVGRADETDTAHPITPLAGPLSVPIGLAGETDTAFPIAPLIGTLSVPIGRATETDTAFPITPMFDQSIPIGRAEEFDTARPIQVRMSGAPTPFSSGPCQDWKPLWCGELSAAAMAVTGDAVAMATEVLWSLSGQRFGLCEVTLRPCRDDCSQGMGSWSDWWSGIGYSESLGGGPRPWWWDGVWVNVCGDCLSGCSCTALDTALLPAPTREVLEVRMDGVVLDPSAYRVDENRKLVRTDGSRWPTCQRMDLSDDQPGTWSVRITVGEDVPMVGRRAVAQLAEEFARDCVGEECTVPYNITSLVRQGVTLYFGDPRRESLDVWVRLLGLPMVRIFLATYNPGKLAHRGKAYDVDRNPRPWRRVNTS